MLSDAFALSSWTTSLRKLCLKPRVSHTSSIVPPSSLWSFSLETLNATVDVRDNRIAPRAFRSRISHSLSDISFGFWASRWLMGLSFERKIKIFLVQTVFDLHLSDFEVRAVESFNFDLSFVRHYELRSDISCWIDNNVDEEKRRNHKSNKNTRNYVQNSNQENLRSRTQIQYSSEIHGRRRETS